MKPRPHNHHSRRRPPPVMSSLPSPQPPQPPSSSVTSAALPPPSGEMRLDCNLASLCEHIQAEGFGSGEFSDVAVQAMGSTYRLHRLILSRSAYFRNMLHGPWKEAGAPTVVLQIDDPNVNSEAIAMSLAYLYGQSPKLNDNNAFRVLAAASFLDIQDLCSICTDFIIAELWTTNFLQYQVFAESQDYGIHGERVRSACWGYLCQSATMELRNLLPKLSSQTLHALITSDELWVPNEEKRFELALYTLLAKGAISDEDESSSDSIQKGKNVINSSSSGQLLEFELINMHINNDNLGSKSTQNSIINLADCMAEFQSGVSCSNLVSNDSKPAIEGPSTSSTNNSYNFNEPLPNNNNNNNIPSSWGNNNRTVGRRKVKNAPAREGSFPLPSDEYESFMNMFEGGSLLYCNMSFESLLHARKQLEELGFPCKALNDGLWLQMLLCHRVQAVVADTCRNCCLTSNSCACRQTYGYSHGGNYYRQDQSTSPGSSNNNNINNVTNNNNVDSVYISEAQGDGTVHFGPTRVHRGASDGLAGIGRGSPTSTAWGPTRYVFSRIPVGSETSHSVSSHAADVSGDGLTVLVGLSEGGFGGPAGMSGARVEMVDVSGEESEWGEMEEEGGCGWGEISLDFKTPLSHFPPFRFGVEFEDVHRLTDGQVKHSVEVFYAGSLWKVSVQAFNDEDPQGRRTLGLFLHRRKAEVTDPLRKAHIYIDSREKVTARYQLICPSKREVMVFGSLKQAGTLLPKAPKGWGWRTALLFDELADLLQAGSLRIAAIVQLV